MLKHTPRRHAYLNPTILSASAALAFVLYRFPPERYSFYPVCPIHQFTGLLCPGCGMTRALSALLRGHLLDALHWNPLSLILLPALLLWLLATAAGRQPPSLPGLSTLHLTLALTALACFTLARNL